MTAARHAPDTAPRYGPHPPLLTAEEEVELAGRITAGDREARDRMISSNIGLVISAADHYRRRGMEMDDLVQAGMLGLLRAVDGFDPALGWRFSTYASKWIRQRIGRAIVDTGSAIRRPAHVHQEDRAARREGREPVGVPPVAVVLDEACADPTRGSFVATFADHREADPADGAGAAEAAEMVAVLLAKVHPRHREVLCRRFGIGVPAQTPTEIGRALGVSKQAVNQCAASALARLRAHVGRHGLPGPARDPWGRNHAIAAGVTAAPESAS